MTDDELHSAISEGLTSSEIAARHGITRRQVNRRRADLGLSGSPGRPVERPPHLDDPDWLWSASLPELADAAGVSVSTVSRARRACK